MDPAKYSTYDVRIRAVKAILTGQRKIDVAKAYQIDYTTLYRWWKRYNDSENFSGLQRQSGSGRPHIMDLESRERLMDIVMQPASHFGYETDFWTCRRLVQVTEQELRTDISQPTMWRTLRDLDLTYQKPRRQYFEIDVQKRLHAFYLPPYSPDFNPDEQVWNYLKHEDLKSHQARTKDQLHALANSKLDSMSKNSVLLQGIFAERVRQEISQRAERLGMAVCFSFRKAFR